MKDPAFLFYSKDYYEGTRTMLPEERACYIDLMCYQHQNGIIPKDIERVLMYCSGVSKATLKATLKAKFKETPNGWYNERLKKVIEDRSNFTAKQSINGTVGQFWKRSKNLLTIKEYKELGKQLSVLSKDDIAKITKNINFENKTTLKASLKHCLSIYANVNVNAIIIDKTRSENQTRFDKYDLEISKNPELYSDEEKTNLLNKIKVELLGDKTWVVKVSKVFYKNSSDTKQSVKDFINYLDVNEKKEMFEPILNIKRYCVNWNNTQK